MVTLFSVWYTVNLQQLYINKKVYVALRSIFISMKPENVGGKVHCLLLQIQI